ncbi:MAG: ABC transporter permease [Bryobacteraceae bacterium]
MQIRSILRETLDALTFNRQRSLLTIISLAWGVTCFVILYSYGEGFNVALTTSFKAVGQDLILMFGGQTSSQAGGERSGRKIRLEETDVEAIREAVPGVAAISPEVLLRRTTVVRGYRSQSMTVRGVLPVDYQQVRNMTMMSGHWLTTEDHLEKARTAVLGAQAAEKLFGEMPPENEIISINGMQFRVAGVLRTKIQISNYNTPDNECVFISYGTASLLHDIKYPEDIVWTPTNPLFRAQALKQVRETLARVHHFAPQDDRAIEVLVFNEFMKQIDTMSAALRILLGLIGALTLAIGGVGLANIMLVAVTQRTREIGIVKSLGATRRSILWQFLLEAMTIVTIGGVLGVSLGFGITRVIGSLPLLGPLFKDTSGAGDIHLSISAFAVITSTMMLEIVGLISGFLPALRAARLDPIEALRYE